MRLPTGDFGFGETFWTISDSRGVIPDEHWCEDHEPGEVDYLKRHGLQHSGDIELFSEDFGWCQETGCERAASEWTPGIQHEINELISEITEGAYGRHLRSER